MESRVFYSNKQDEVEAVEEVLSGIDESVMPDLVLVYSTLKYHGEYQRFLDVLGERFQGVPQVGGTVDGFVYEGGLRTSGLAVVLCWDEDASIDTFNVESRDYSGLRELAGDMDDGVLFLHYPLVYLPSSVDVLSIVARAKYYDLVGGSDAASREEYAARMSRYLDGKGVFNLPQRILGSFEGCDVPVVGVNLGHFNPKRESPRVFHNYSDIGNGVSGLIIEKEGVDVVSDDIYPSKAGGISETRDRVMEELKCLRSFSYRGSGNVISSIDGVPPMEKVEGFKGGVVSSEEFREKVEEESISGESPFIMFLLNSDTGGGSFLGVSNIYPFSYFPSYLDFDSFDDELYFGYEPAKGKLFDYISSVDGVSGSGFVFSVFDVASISIFGDMVLEYRDYLEEQIGDNYFSVLSVSPSVYLPRRFWRRDYLVEVSNNVLFAGSGLSVSVEI
ncbi:MAG: hypothetical protein EF811_00060 [Methanonatronarchaeia archaeon]|nr:MAG: hypothetical protein EF811_00060 [Methanonatronarchaeia archaeon]